MAFTFDPHPTQVLAPRHVPKLLLSLEGRLDHFSALGIRAVRVIPFTQAFSKWSPEKFVQQLLVNELGAVEVVVGHDFGFGKGRSGSVATLKALGRQLGFRVHAVSPVCSRGQRIASAQIRQMIAAGRLEVVARFLGRAPTVTGRIIHGAGRGKKLGFSTANLKVAAGILPPVGVYVVEAYLGKRRLGGMANLGFRPTFEKRSRSGQPTLEVHFFGAHRSLYGKTMELAFIKRLRAEHRFASPQALARQLNRDASLAQQILSRRRD